MTYDFSQYFLSIGDTRELVNKQNNLVTAVQNALNGGAQVVQTMGVLDKDLTTPPGSPADGAAYIVAATATGAWAGKEKHIAVWLDSVSAWTFIAPAEGLLSFVSDESKYYTYSSGTWVLGIAGIVGSVNNNALVYFNGSGELTSDSRFSFGASGGVGTLFEVQGLGVNTNGQINVQGTDGTNTSFVSLLSGLEPTNLPSLFFSNGLRFSVASDKAATGYSELARLTTTGLKISSMPYDITVSGLAHGNTDFVPTDVAARYGHQGTAGGAYVVGASSSNADAVPFLLQGVFGSSDPTDTVPAIKLQAIKKSGGTGGQAISDAETAFQLLNYTNPLLTVDGAGNLLPGADNAQNIGSGSLRPATIYAASGTINTSDAREKTPVRSLNENELAAARELAREPGVYQFLASVAEKGEDGARLHIGMTVQRAIEIMESHGLDPLRYGFICHDVWEAETKEVPAEDGEFSRPVTRQVVEAVPVEYSEIEIIEGVPTRVKKSRLDQVPVVDQVGVVDEDGEPVMIEDQPAKFAVTNKEGEIVEPAQPATFKQLTAPVQRMETVEERYNVVTVREAGDRYSFRPDQLNSFMIAGLASLLG